jgi:hypothetical protein
VRPRAASEFGPDRRGLAKSAAAVSALAQATEPHEPEDTRKQEDLAAGLGYLHAVPCVSHLRVRILRIFVRIGPIDIV